MVSKTKSFASLIWIVFIDSLGWGIAFSVFAALFFTEQSNILPANFANSTRYMFYEFLLAIYSVFMFFFAPVIGGIADHYGRKPALKISMMGLTLGFILSALGCYWSSLAFLILGRIVSGITAGSLSVAQAAVVDMSTAETKSFYLSILMLANCLGFSLGPILGGIFAIPNFLPTGTVTFLIATVMSIAGLLSVLFFFKETYLPTDPTAKLNFFKDFSNIKIAFCKPILNIYLFSLLFVMVAFGLFFSDVPVFLSRAFNSSSATTGVVLSTEAILFSLTLTLSGKYIFNYFEKINVVILTQLIQLLSYFLLSFNLHSFTLNIILFSIISAFTGVMYIGLLTLISDATESDWQGRVMGVVAALSSVTWGIGPILTGGLNNFGAEIAFISCIFLVVVGVAALIMLKVNLRKRVDVTSV